MTAIPLAKSLQRFAQVGRSDAELLAAFRARRDEAAFAELVRRHAGLVAGVCRRALGQAQDAEDAIQATFLVLARKAHAVSKPERLAGWLHTVAMRASEEVRSMRERQRRGDAARPRFEAVSDKMSNADLAAVLDEEVARLPEIYRLAVLNCELQGQSRSEAAAALQIPEGTLSSRLAEAKRRLARRLKQRGITAGATTIAAALAQRSDAGITVSQLAGLARTAAAFVAGDSARATGPALVVADAVIKMMFVSKLKCLATIALVMAVVGGGYFLVPGKGPNAALAGEPSTANVDPSKLVQMLGSDKFSDRQEAQRRLIAMGPRAESAVRAGMASGDAEIVKRCAAILPHLWVAGLRKFDHPAWIRFRKLVGDTKASRDLFLQMIEDPRRAALIGAAEANPDRAGEIYKSELTERVHALEAGYLEASRLYALRTGVLRPVSGIPTRGELGTLLFLGTHSSTAAVTYSQAGDKEHVSYHNLFSLALSNERSPDAKPIPPEIRRLFAAWLAVRTDPEPLRFGMYLALYHDMREVLPAARAAAANKDLAPEPKGFAVLAVGQFGTKADLSLLERSYANQNVFNHGSYTTAKNEHMPIVARVSDAAIAAALHLCGQHPADFGYTFLAEYKERGPQELVKYQLLGFFDDAARQAAHKKALDWLAKQPSPEKEPDPAALIRQLGSDKFAEREDAQQKLRKLGSRALPAVRGGMKDTNREISRRCVALEDDIRADLAQALADKFNSSAQDDYGHPVWQRFKRIAGDDLASRQLFAEMIADPRRLRMLDDAESDPEKQAALYREEAARQSCNAIYAVAKQMPGGYRLVEGGPRESELVPPPEKITSGTLAALFMLGSYASTAIEVAGKDRAGRAIHEAMVVDTNAFMMASGSSLDSRRFAMRKLFAAWLDRRVNQDALESAYWRATSDKIAEAAPAARRRLDADRAATSGDAYAALYLARCGDKSDLPRLARLLDNHIVARKVIYDRKPAPVQIRDAALAASLLLYGQNPADFGFDVLRIRNNSNADAYDMAWLGFWTDDSREAAHKKGRQFLVSQKQE